MWLPFRWKWSSKPRVRKPVLRRPWLEDLEERWLPSGNPLVTALTTHRSWITYSPSMPSGQYECNPTTIEQDLQTLFDEGWRGLVTYTTLGGFSQIPELAKSIGFDYVIAGIYNISPTAPASCGINNPYQAELDNVTNPAINQYIDGFMVGNEGLTDGRYSLAQLTAYFNMLDSNASTMNLPKTTSEISDQYLGGANAATLLGLGDWLFPNINFMCWANAFEDPNATWTNVSFAYNAILTAEANAGHGLETIVHESWYASGDAFAPSDPLATQAMQLSYYQLMVGGTGIQNNQDFYFIWGEAFDGPWKINLPPCNVNQQPQPFYGLHDVNRTAKSVITTLKSSYTGLYPTAAPPAAQPALASSLAADESYVVAGATGSATRVLAIKIFDGAGNLVSTVQPFNNLTSLRVATGDFDGDGDADEFAVLGRRTGIDFRAEIVTYDLGADGQAVETGRFFAFAPGILGNGFIAAGDFDDDGDDDIAVAQIGGGRTVVTLQIHVNTGAGFVAGGSTTLDFGVISAPRIAAGLVDNDRFADIVIAARTPAGAEVRIVNAQDPFAAPSVDGGFVWDFGIAGYQRGAFVAVGEFDPLSAHEEIVLGSNVGGGGRLDILHFDGVAATLVENGRLTPFGAGYNGAVRVAAGTLGPRTILIAAQDRFQEGQVVALARDFDGVQTNPDFEAVPPFTAFQLETGPSGNQTLGPFISFADPNPAEALMSAATPSLPRADELDDIDLMLALKQDQDAENLDTLLASCGCGGA